MNQDKNTGESWQEGSNRNDPLMGGDTGHERFREALYAEELIPGLEEHLVTCSDCRQLAARLERIDRLNMEEPIPEPSPTLVDDILAKTIGTHARQSAAIVIDGVREREVSVLRDVFIEVASYLNLRERASARIRLGDDANAVAQWGNWESEQIRLLVQYRSPSNSPSDDLPPDLLAALAQEGRLAPDVWSRLRQEPWAMRLTKLLGQDWEQASPAVGKMARLVTGCTQEASVRGWRMRLVSDDRAIDLVQSLGLRNPHIQLLCSVELRMNAAPGRAGDGLGGRLSRVVDGFRRNLLASVAPTLQAFNAALTVGQFILPLHGPVTPGAMVSRGPAGDTGAANQGSVESGGRSVTSEACG